jgi:hypothetical protein
VICRGKRKKKNSGSVKNEQETIVSGRVSSRSTKKKKRRAQTEDVSLVVE